MLNWMRARYIDDSELYSGVIFTTRIVQPTDLEWGDVRVYVKKNGFDGMCYPK